LCPPLLFKFLLFDVAPPLEPAVVDEFVLLYTGERRCCEGVELVDVFGIDVLLPPVTVVDEPLLSGR